MYGSHSGRRRHSETSAHAKGAGLEGVNGVGETGMVSGQRQCEPSDDATVNMREIGLAKPLRCVRVEFRVVR